jgi:hypothetical protein
MGTLDRRQLLSGFLSGLVQAAGTVVLARSVLSAAQGQAHAAEASPESQASLQERADQVAATQGSLNEEEGLQPISFANGGFANGGGGGFRKGGFANGGGGGFRKGGFANGGFRNGGGGGFRKGGFANGGFRN